MSLLNNLRKLFKLDNNLKTEDRIYRDIEELTRTGDNWQNTLNREAIWLFLASLGLWSIPLSPLVSHRLVVALLLLMIFSTKLDRERRKSNIKESFPKTINRIEAQIILSNLNEKTKESMLYKLSKAKAKITGISAYKNTWIFTICWCYYGICCLFFVDTVLVSIRDRIIQFLQLK